MTSSRAVPLALAVLIGVLPLTSPEHVHESDIDGHHEALIHRHAESHFPGDEFHHQGPDSLVFDHQDVRTITLDSSFTVPASYVGAAPVAPLVAVLAPPPVTLEHGPTSDVERLIHSPPRAPTGLRAPPRSARL